MGGSNGGSDTHSKINLRLKKVPQDDPLALVPGVEDVVLPSTASNMKGVVHEFRGQNNGNPVTRDLGGFWTFPKDTLDAPCHESKESRHPDENSSGSFDDFVPGTSATGNPWLSGLQKSGEMTEAQRRMTCPALPTKNTTGDQAMRQSASTTTTSPFSAANPTSASNTNPKPSSTQHGEGSSGEGEMYEPYTEAELVQYEMEGLTRPDSLQSEKKNADVFFFEEEATGWHGVGYGSYATAAQTETDQRKLFEDIIKQAEARSCPV